MELTNYIEATEKLNDFSDWVTWNLSGRSDQIQYLKKRVKEVRNRSRLFTAIKKEIKRLELEPKWN